MTTLNLTFLKAKCLLEAPTRLISVTYFSLYFLSFNNELLYNSFKLFYTLYQHNLHLLTFRSS